MNKITPRLLYDMLITDIGDTTDNDFGSSQRIKLKQTLEDNEDKLINIATTIIRKAKTEGNVLKHQGADGVNFLYYIYKASALEFAIVYFKTKV